MTERELIPPQFGAIHEDGEQLAQDIITRLEHLAHRAMMERTFRDDDEDIAPAEHMVAPVGPEELRDRAYHWFNRITFEVLPYTTLDRADVSHLLRRVSAVIGSRKYVQEDDAEVRVESSAALSEAQDVMTAALRLVKTAVAPTHASRLGYPALPTTAANTAFILMWMDKAKPELVDVHEVVKEVFAEFGIEARRADDVQHQERITDLVLQQILQAEFLFADLTGERPNVYYEVGFAHAVGKHPILYRRTGTSLHFDLSVHNVPEYANVTELRRLLRDSLAAVTGRGPRSARASGA